MRSVARSTCGNWRKSLQCAKYSRPSPVRHSFRMPSVKTRLLCKKPWTSLPHVCVMCVRKSTTASLCLYCAGRSSLQILAPSRGSAPLAAAASRFSNSLLVSCSSSLEDFTWSWVPRYTRVTSSWSTRAFASAQPFCLRNNRDCTVRAVFCCTSLKHRFCNPEMSFSPPLASCCPMMLIKFWPMAFTCLDSSSLLYRSSRSSAEAPFMARSMLVYFSRSSSLSDRSV
mmetsp:Transcript_58087/g.176987  ORF Transcript_58087/g.176987 Transcript_58087/m.176987 type:complete len:227 (+) Transcript_58087:231-911(+)